MPQRSLLSSPAQRVLNSVVAAVLLLTTAVLSQGSPAPPPEVSVLVDDSGAAREFAAQLPSDLTFDDRMGTAVFARLTSVLPDQGAAAMDQYRTGDIAYVPSEQSIVVFLTDGQAVPDSGLILLGHVTSGMHHLAGCVRNCAIEFRVESAR